MKSAIQLFASVAVLCMPATASAGEAAAGSTRLVGTVLNSVAVDKQLAFYETAFGLKVGMTLDHGTRREYMLRFSQDATEAGLIIVHDSAADPKARLSHGDAFARIILRVDDMDALLTRLDRAGIAHQPVQEAATGHRILLLDDPEGYSLEVIQSGSPKPASAK